MVTELTILFGDACNFHCAYCYRHMMTGNQTVDYGDMPHLKEYIWNAYKDEDIMITYLGGEPLCYWERLKPYLDYFGTKSNVVQRIITNGSLTTPEIVEYVNKYQIIFAVSHDGAATKYTRDTDVLKDKSLMKLFNQIQRLVISVALTKYNPSPYDNYRYIKRLFQKKDISIMYSNLQVYKDNAYLAEDFDFEAYIDGNVKLIPITPYIATTVRLDRLGYCLCSDGKKRNQLTGAIVGYFDETGLHEDDSAKEQAKRDTNCPFEQCPHYMVDCTYKHLQVEDTEFCQKISEADHIVWNICKEKGYL